MLLPALVCLGACQRQAPERNSGEVAEPLHVVEVRIGAMRDGRPVPQTSDAPILATVALRGTAQGHVLKARLLDLRDGRQVGLVERAMTRSDQVQSLRFDNAAGWQPGRYMLEVTLDGKLASQQDVDVMEPAKGAPRTGS
ncbi:hypothetical protein [Xanthomonas sacchari]|nr:hypothetical protein [Xanthomonas sacchari]MDV0439770.1 hypothetical protein [Xanthomonas sacchari]